MVSKCGEEGRWHLSHGEEEMGHLSCQEEGRRHLAFGEGMRHHDNGVGQEEGARLSRASVGEGTCKAPSGWKRTTWNKEGISNEQLRAHPPHPSRSRALW